MVFTTVESNDGKGHAQIRAAAITHIRWDALESSAFCGLRSCKKGRAYVCRLRFLMLSFYKFNGLCRQGLAVEAPYI